MQAILTTRTDNRLEDIVKQAEAFDEVNQSKALVLATTASTTNPT